MTPKNGLGASWGSGIHQGELVLDPFVGSETTLVAARDLGRNAVGFDVQKKYIDLCGRRLAQLAFFNNAEQIAVQDDARNIPEYFEPETLSLVLTSPPYANPLNRKRKNKSRRSNQRKNEQYEKVEQYSGDPKDLGTLYLDDYTKATGEVFEGILPLLKPRVHCVINVPDVWWEDSRATIHIAVVEALRGVGYELRNIIIWDRTNIVNKIGIFSYPSDHITTDTTFEYLLDF